MYLKALRNEAFTTTRVHISRLDEEALLRRRLETTKTGQTEVGIE